MTKFANSVQLGTNALILNQSQKHANLVNSALKDKQNVVCAMLVHLVQLLHQIAHLAKLAKLVYLDHRLAQLAK
jgi:hypothetical protein